MKRNDIDANVGNGDCDNSADRSVRVCVGWLAFRE